MRKVQQRKSLVNLRMPYIAIIVAISSISSELLHTTLTLKGG